MALGGFGTLLFSFLPLCGFILTLVAVITIGMLLYMPNFSYDVDLTYDTKRIFPKRQ